MARILRRALTTLVVLATAADAQQTASPLDFSGLIFGAYSLRTDSGAGAALVENSRDQFSIDGFFLNFRMPAGDNGSIRVTTDIFQNANPANNAYYQGWSV